MKISALPLLIAFIFILSTVCACQPEIDKIGPILSGEHQLRKITERIEQKSQVSGGFFIFVGGISSSSEAKVSVKFAWKMNDGIYAISSLPLEKIRVRIDNRQENPTISFCYSKDDRGHWELQEIMRYFVNYAIITVKDSDWPVKIQMPLN